MFTRDVGGGPCVLLLHGTPSPADDFDALVEVLAPAFRVLVPDLPGYGRSPALENPTVERVGDAIASMLRERGVERLHAVVGYSTGVYRALDLVLRHRREVRLLVALAGMATFDEAGRQFRAQFAARLRNEPGLLHSDELADLMLALMASPGWCATHPDDAERIRRWPTITSAAALAAELDALAAARDLRPELAALPCAVYVWVGELDAGAPPEWSHDLAQCVGARATVDIVPACGHAILVEDREATAAAIRARLVAA